MTAKIYTVSELTFAIKSLLEPTFRAVSLRGEISNFKLQASGHLYFSLKDSGSQISAVLFKGNAASLSRMPKEGDQVFAKGEITLYAPRGQYQIAIRELQFLGVGELLLKLQQRKELLQARGWFDPGHKKKLPKFPKRIGVVTSPTGAVIQDITHVLTRRFGGVHLILNPVKVQGEGAAEEIARAISDFNKYHLADVLIVGRGGGSIEDLWAFNEEIVARAIFESHIPIISAIGHETDTTIADWVADVIAPTPSAAAEIAICEKTNLLKFLKNTRQICQGRISEQIAQLRRRLDALQKHPFLSSPYSLLGQRIQQLDAIQSELHAAFQRTLQQRLSKIDSFSRQLSALKPSAQLNTLKQRLSLYPLRLKAIMDPLIRTKRERLSRLEEHLRSLHPQNLLKKGYAILFSEKDRSVILSVKNIEPHHQFTVLLHDGRAHATVNQVEKNESGNSLF